MNAVTPTLQAALVATSASFGVTERELIGKCRVKHLAQARHAFVLLARTSCEKSLPAIAAFCNRDHTTALNSQTRALGLLETNREWSERYHRAKASIDEVSTMRLQVENLARRAPVQTLVLMRRFLEMDAKKVETLSRELLKMEGK